MNPSRTSTRPLPWPQLLAPHQAVVHMHPLPASSAGPHPRLELTAVPTQCETRLAPLDEPGRSAQACFGATAPSRTVQDRGAGSGEHRQQHIWERTGGRSGVPQRGRAGRPDCRACAGAGAPSGDTLLTWRLIGHRPAGQRLPPEGVRASTVDTLDCVAWSAEPQRAARRLETGDVVSSSARCGGGSGAPAPVPPAGARSRSPWCGACAGR